MATKRQKHTREYKLEAFRMASKGDRSVAAVVRDLGIHPESLYQRKREIAIDEPEAFRGDGVLRYSVQTILFPNDKRKVAVSFRRACWRVL